jgi:hypothetical protein
VSEGWLTKLLIWLRDGEPWDGDRNEMPTTMTFTRATHVGFLIEKDSNIVSLVPDANRGFVFCDSIGRHYHVYDDAPAERITFDSAGHVISRKPLCTTG